MGAVYPLWIEKLVFFLIIASGIYAGYALGDHMSGVTLFPHSFMRSSNGNSIPYGRRWEIHPVRPF